MLNSIIASIAKDTGSNAVMRFLVVCFILSSVLLSECYCCAAYEIYAFSFVVHVVVVILVEQIVSLDKNCQIEWECV